MMFDFGKTKKNWGGSKKWERSKIWFWWFYQLFFLSGGSQNFFLGRFQIFLLGGYKCKEKNMGGPKLFFVCWADDKKMDGEGIKTRLKFDL